MIILKYIIPFFSLGIEIWAALKIQEKYFVHRGKKLLSICLVLLFFLLSDRIGTLFNNYLAFAVMRLVSFLLLFCIFYNGTLWGKLSVACLALAMIHFTENICTALFSILNLLLLHRRSTLLWVDSGVLISCLSSICTVIIVWLSFQKMNLKTALFSKQYGKILFISTCSLIFLTDLVSFGISRGVSFVSDANKNGYWNPHLNELLTHLECMILAGLSITIILCLTIGINKMMQYALSEQIHHAKAAHYQTLLEEYEKQTRLRHDMKNHIIGISALLEKKDYKQLKKYIDRMAQDGNLKEQNIHTGNTVIDAILHIKRQTALKNQIAFICDLHLAKPIEMEDFDLCILLGNLLDNAIQAEKEIEKQARSVRVRAEIVKRNLVMEIRNTCYSAEPNTFFDTKNYGTGLWNVKNIVEKNRGILELSVTGTEFCASVMLPVVNIGRL